MNYTRVCVWAAEKELTAVLNRQNTNKQNENTSSENQSRKSIQQSCECQTTDESNCNKTNFKAVRNMMELGFDRNERKQFHQSKQSNLFR